MAACGVCRTDLQLAEAISQRDACRSSPGTRSWARRGARPRRRGLGVGDAWAWLAGACGVCAHCRAGRENSASRALHGLGSRRRLRRAADGARRLRLRLPAAIDDLAAAPLLCGGVIGYRSLRLSRRSSPAAGSASSASAPRRAWRSRSPSTGAARCTSARARRPSSAARSSSARSGPAATTTRRRSRSTPRSRSRRSASGGRRAPRARSRRHRRHQRHPPRPHPGVPLRPALVGARLRRRELHPRTRGSSSSWRRRSRSGPETTVFALDEAAEALAAAGSGRGSAARRCCA